MPGASLLLSFRILRDWDVQHIASKLSISAEEYLAYESGLRKMENEVALKLAWLYDVPVLVFVTESITPQIFVTYSNCDFTNSNGYVNHNYSDEPGINHKDEILKMLKKEIEVLRKQNQELIGMLGKNKGSC